MKKISLIVATYGRSTTLVIFLKSVQKNTFKNIEIIICDQNPDDRIIKLCSEFTNTLNIKIIKTPIGLSISRNHGINNATGDIIGFPDDDCFYSDNLIEEVINSFQTQKSDIIIARWENPDPHGHQPHKNKRSHIIENYKEIFSLMSSELFFSNDSINKLKQFDENLGLGSKGFYQGGEDYEILLRAMKNGLKIFYNANAIMYHPFKAIDSNEINKEIIKSHKKRLTQAGASDYKIFLLHLSFVERMRLLFNNILMTFICLLTFQKRNLENHFLRLRGFMKAMFIEGKI